MIINTQRFGSTTVDPDSLLHCLWPILGFRAHRNFAVLPSGLDDPRIYLLQSCHDAEVAFYGANIREFFPHYPEQTRDIPEGFPGSPATHRYIGLLSTTASAEGAQYFMNLKSPLIIDADTKAGGQIIVSNPYNFYAAIALTRHAVSMP